MPYVFNKKAAKGVKIIFQFIITGDEKFEGFLSVDNGQCCYIDGINEKADLVFESSSAVWLGIARGDIRGDIAYLKKMYDVKGDLEKLALFQKLFSDDKKETGDAIENSEKNDGEYVNETELFNINYGEAKPGEIKKVLLIQSSPRTTVTSKTEIVSNAFIEGCKSAGAETEVVYLKDLKIKECCGCYSCWTKTPGKCIFDDDVKVLLEKMQNAQLIVITFPLYHFGMNSSMKKLFERTLPMHYPYLVSGETGDTTHPTRDKYKNEPYYAAISVCGFPESENFKAASYHIRTLLDDHTKTLSGKNDISGNSSNRSVKLLAEIYRPASEVLDNPFYKDETDRVLGHVKQAAFEAISKGKVNKECMREISRIGFDKELFKEQANLHWEELIHAGKTPAWNDVKNFAN